MIIMIDLTFFLMDDGVKMGGLQPVEPSTWISAVSITILKTDASSQAMMQWRGSGKTLRI